MPTFQFLQSRRVLETGELWDIAFQPGLNLLIGAENTSKTTTLRIIDFCLGDDKNAADRFGNTITNEYERFELRLEINGAEHTLVRRLKTPRQTTLVEADGQLMTTAEFNEWIASELGWPQIRIPRGRSFTTATEENMLSFRAVYRHIHRKPDSWTCFASEEQEYWRRAVVAFFLGIAEEVYRGTQVQITRMQLEIDELTRRRHELRATLDDVVRRIAEGYRQVGSVSLDSVGDLLSEIDAEIEETLAERQRLAEQVRADPAYDAQQDAALASLNESIQHTAQQYLELSQALGEQYRLLQTFDGDISRLERARLATVALSSINVTACPACHQPIVNLGGGDATEPSCYVCHQPLVDDLRQRRLELEERALQQEKKELEDVVRELGQRLDAINERNVALSAERDSLLTKIDAERKALITPLLREFEQVQHVIGQLRQRRESLARLAELQERVSQLDNQRIATQERLARLQGVAADRPSDRALIIERTNHLAMYMNEFISRLPTPEGIGGSVTVDDRDFSFFVGREKWDNALGNKRRVLFLIAYHYALLKLSTEGEVPHPGLAILDNPFQQDVEPELVIHGLNRLRELCTSNPTLQVIVATRRPLPEIGAHRILFNSVFNPETDGT